MMKIPVDIWSLIIDEVARLPSGNSESWSNRTSELAKLAQICKATEVGPSEMAMLYVITQAVTEAGYREA